MQRTSLLGLLAIALMLITSCSSGDKSAIAIPKDAGLVVHINTPSLTSKLSWKEIQQTKWFQKAYAEADDSLAKRYWTIPIIQVLIQKLTWYSLLSARAEMVIRYLKEALKTPPPLKT
ncbi:hypothetical protein [Paraflavitalea speifideaquila]|uniref:hypothetical protein n=1 Tax=Paraflavitalea speifideaquila TaxID=3076558 RepID=UPI0028ED852C|nr:hypothetical protein [Paraflavitalea speifideiaquila]